MAIIDRPAVYAGPGEEQSGLPEAALRELHRRRLPGTRRESAMTPVVTAACLDAYRTSGSATRKG